MEASNFPTLYVFPRIESRRPLLEESGKRLTGVRRAHSFAKLRHFVLGGMFDTGSNLTAQKLLRGFECSQWLLCQLLCGFFRRSKNLGIRQNLGYHPHTEGAGCVERMAEKDDLSRAKIANLIGQREAGSKLRHQS